MLAKQSIGKSKKNVEFVAEFQIEFPGLPLEKHVVNHRQVHDGLLKHYARIECAFPRMEQNSEHLIDSINCTYSALQESTGIIRANFNITRGDFKAVHSSLIEIDPYYRSICSAGSDANVSSIGFKDGRGSSGVDLLWHPKEDFIKLYKEKRDELMN